MCLISKIIACSSVAKKDVKHELSSVELDFLITAARSDFLAYKLLSRESCLSVFASHYFLQIYYLKLFVEQFVQGWSWSQKALFKFQAGKVIPTP